ncbi:MAG: hypothetical protein ABI583_10685 [Betaproteobacteria bacterium]
MNFVAKIDICIDGQQLHAQHNICSMLVKARLAVDKQVPFSYRLYLIHGLGTGTVRWPVALAFSLAAT